MAHSPLRVLCSTASPTEASLELENGDFIAVGSQHWECWLEENVSFRFESGFAGEDSFTARRQDREGGKYWFAYRKVSGKTRNAYLGKAESLTVVKMLEVASKLSQSPQPKAKAQQLVTGYAQERVTSPEQTVELEAIKAEAEQLRSHLASLQRENAQLRSQLAESEKLANDLKWEAEDAIQKAGQWYERAKEVEESLYQLNQNIEQTRSQPVVDPQAIALLQNAITSKSKGGSYAANNATGLKRLIEQVLGLLATD